MKLKVLRNISLTAECKAFQSTSVEKSGGALPGSRDPEKGLKQRSGKVSFPVWPAGVSEEGRKATEKGPLSWALM